MRKLRIFLGWIFAFTMPVCIVAATRTILHISHRHHIVSFAHILAFALLFVLLASIFGMAWWTVWKGKITARLWGVGASLIYILLSLWEIIYLSRSVWSDFGGMLTVGITGIVVFLWPVGAGGPVIK